MTAQEFYNKYQGQSLLWAPSPSREWLRGECVQAVCFYVADNGKPVIWADAYAWFAGGVFPEHYERIANTPDAVPRSGDIIIWGPNTPGSGGAGHIAVCLSANGSSFVSVDQNWGGKTVHLVTHNYNYVVGWLRIKGQVPAPQPQQGGDEMIANADQATKIYQMLRPNGGGSPDEINGTAGRRTFAGFLNDAQPEINARNAALRDQSQHMADMQAQINKQNQTITDLNVAINNDKLSDAEKQKAYDTAMAKVTDQNAEITSLHDKITDLQKVVIQPNANAAEAEAKKSASLLIRLLSKFIKPRKK